MGRRGGERRIIRAVSCLTLSRRLVIRWLGSVLQQLVACGNLRKSASLYLTGVFVVPKRVSYYGVCEVPIMVGFGLFLFPRSQKIINF